jgi:predicted esterase
MLIALGACRSRGLEPTARAVAKEPAPIVEPHPVTSALGTRVESLPPLRAEWLERVGDGAAEVVIMPPIGAIEPSRLVIGVHGAGDRPDWACGGWRLGSAVTAFIACPQGVAMTKMTFGWSTPEQLQERALATLEVVKQRHRDYLSNEPLIYAGFSQGATFAEPLLRKHAALFPIAILAEGGYRTAQSPSFAKAYRDAGGRRIVLVCGNPGCFTSARGSKRVLEAAGLQVLIVGDPKAGHNLNQQMQQALQSSWSEITAPLP